MRDSLCAGVTGWSPYDGPLYWVGVWIETTTSSLHGVCYGSERGRGGGPREVAMQCCFVQSKCSCLTFFILHFTPYATAGEYCGFGVILLQYSSLVAVCIISMD